MLKNTGNVLLQHASREHQGLTWTQRGAFLGPSITLAQVLIPLTPEKKSPQHRDHGSQKHLSPAAGCTLRSAGSAQGSPQIPCLAPC